MSLPQTNEKAVAQQPPAALAYHTDADSSDVAPKFADPEAHRSASPAPSDDSTVPEKYGVVSANRVLQVITSKDIHIAYFALFVLVLAQDFAQYIQSPFTAYATSAFKTHSQLAAAGVISRVFSVTTYTVMSKIVDNNGRISPTIFVIVIMSGIIGDSMMGGCRNVQTYLGANVFNGMGGTGFTFAMQIYIASTTSIVSRGFWNVAADSISSIITMYSGAEIGGMILENWGVADGWRWGYGMWCIIIFVMAIPFITILYSWHARVRRTPDLEPLPKRGSFIDLLFHEYDVIGVVFFCAGLALILVPLTMAKGVASKWDGKNIAMLCVGCASCLMFVIWSLPKRLRPRFMFKPRMPLVPWHTLRTPAVFSLFFINMFDFLSYGMFTTYFQTFMQVAVRQSPATATQVDNTLRIVFQVTAILVGLLMRFWTPLCIKLGLGPRRFHTGWALYIGIPLCTLGIALDIYFVQRPHASNAVACFVVAKLIYGIGRGIFQTAGQVATQAAAKRSELAIATGIFYMGSSIGGAIGVACSGAIWLNILPDQLAHNLPEGSKDLAKSIFGSIVTAIKYDPATEIGIAITKSYVHTMKIIAIVATCLQLPMLLFMLFTNDLALTEDEQVSEGGRRIAMTKKSQPKEEEEEKH